MIIARQHIMKYTNTTVILNIIKDHVLKTMSQRFVSCMLWSNVHVYIPSDLEALRGGNSFLKKHLEHLSSDTII